MEKIDVLGLEMYYRNNSTGSPTKIHFTKEDGSTFCGWNDFAAEHIVADESDHVIDSQCCKRCLYAVNKKKLCLSQ